MTLREGRTNSNGGTGKNVERDETREVEAFLPALSQHEVTAERKGTQCHLVEAPATMPLMVLRMMPGVGLLLWIWFYFHSLHRSSFSLCFFSWGIAN